MEHRLTPPISSQAASAAGFTSTFVSVLGFEYTRLDELARELRAPEKYSG
jgi:hypothetical protein